MSYENIALKKQNVVMFDNYFYMIDDDTDTLVMKTDDGTQAFSYPLDTIISNEVLSLEYDGRNFWTLEIGSGTDDMTVRRWYINNYVLKLRNTFLLVETGSHKFESDAFTIEHYHENFTQDYSSGFSSFNISDGSKLSSGMTVVFGPNTSGQVEEFSVISATALTVVIGGTTSYAYSNGDPVIFYNNIWMFNNYDGLDYTGALYKISGYTGAVSTKYSGGEYKDVKACTFFDMSSVYGADSEAICYVKATNMISLDPDDVVSGALGSMSMDNIEDDNATVIPIYDVTIDGTNVYRLQLKYTYYGNTGTYDDGGYNYQLSTLNTFITSIALSADPAILSADGASNSTITAIVKDQFNQAISSKTVTFTDDDDDGYFLDPTDDTDSNGVATATYKSGLTAREVKITGTAQQG